MHFIYNLNCYTVEVECVYYVNLLGSFQNPSALINNLCEFFMTVAKFHRIAFVITTTLLRDTSTALSNKLSEILYLVAPIVKMTAKNRTFQPNTSFINSTQLFIVFIFRVCLSYLHQNQWRLLHRGLGLSEELNAVYAHFIQFLRI